MSVPFSPYKWSNIAPGLYMGGHDYMAEDGSIQDVVVEHEFALVLSLYERYGCGPAIGIDRRYARVPDGVLEAEELAVVIKFADLGVEAVNSNRKVLVRCQAGYNRSGLLAAFILMRMGVSAHLAIDVIRSRRSDFALCNVDFVNLIYAEEKRLAGLK